nr:MAG TPA: hypothetical protein [Caudoviricetes sp.]
MKGLSYVLRIQRIKKAHVPLAKGERFFDRSAH